MSVDNKKRYDAYILCKNSTYEEIGNELKLELSGKVRYPRQGFSQDDILIKADRETLEYAVSNYDVIREYNKTGWQKFFDTMRKTEQKIA